MRGITVLLATMAALAGCSIDRAYDVKNQFCEFDANFAYSIDDPMEFVFKRPTILDSDVSKILGAQPTEVRRTEGGQVGRYVIEKVAVDNAAEEVFVVDFHYRTLSGDSKLESVRLERGMESFDWLKQEPDPREIAEAAQRICESGFALRLPSLEEDIDPRYLETVPGKAELLLLLGEPSFESESEKALTYEYRVRSPAGDAPAARVVVWFDETDTRPLQMESRYRGFRSRADLVEGKVRYSFVL